MARLNFHQHYGLWTYILPLQDRQLPIDHHMQSAPLGNHDLLRTWGFFVCMFFVACRRFWKLSLDDLSLILNTVWKVGKAHSSYINAMSWCIGSFLGGPFSHVLLGGDCNPYTRNSIKNHEEMPTCSKFTMFTGLNCSFFSLFGPNLLKEHTEIWIYRPSLLMPHVLALFGDNPGG